MQENCTSNPSPKERRKAKKASQSRAGAHGIWDNIGYFLRYSARRYPALLCMMVVEIAMGVAAPAFGVYLPKLAADLALGESAISPARAALLLGGVALIMAVVYGARDRIWRMRCITNRWNAISRWWSVPRGRLGLPARR